MGNEEKSMYALTKVGKHRTTCIHTDTHTAVGTTYTVGNSLKQNRKWNETFHKQAQALFLQTTRCHCASGFAARHVTLLKAERIPL